MQRNIGIKLIIPSKDCLKGKKGCRNNDFVLRLPPSRHNIYVCIIYLVYLQKIHRIQGHVSSNGKNNTFRT